MNRAKRVMSKLRIIFHLPSNIMITKKHAYNPVPISRTVETGLPGNRCATIDIDASHFLPLPFPIIWRMIVDIAITGISIIIITRYASVHIRYLYIYIRMVFPKDFAQVSWINNRFKDNSHWTDNRWSARGTGHRPAGNWYFEYFTVLHRHKPL